MNRWISAVVLGGVVAVSVSCSDVLFDERDHVYEGSPVVEFAPVLPAGTYVRNVTFGAGSDDTESVSVRINYVAAPPETTVSGDLRVAEGSTAVEGQHFTLPDGLRFEIPAGENFTQVRVDVLGSGLADGESVTLVLELTGAEGAEVSANYRTFEVRASKEAG